MNPTGGHKISTGSSFSCGASKCGYNRHSMAILLRCAPHLDQSKTRRAESLVLLLALACLLFARVLPALSFKVMAMMPMQTEMTAGIANAASIHDIQPRHNCFDDALRCMQMMGALCPLSQVFCALAGAMSHPALQLQPSPRLVDAILASLQSGVPKRPPRS